MADVERETVTLPIDEKLVPEMQRRETEGWKIDPDAKPMATYHMIRTKNQPGAGGIGELSIDDSKIGILRADGSFEPLQEKT